MNVNQYFDDLLKSKLKITTCKSFLRSLYDFPLHFSSLALGDILRLTPVPKMLLGDNLILTPFYDHEQMILLIPRSLCYRQLHAKHPWFSMYATTLGGRAYKATTRRHEKIKPTSAPIPFSGISFSVRCLKEHPDFQCTNRIAQSSIRSADESLNQVLQEFSRNDGVL